MSELEELKYKILHGYKITRQEALKLVETPLEELTMEANKIREHFCGNNFDACTIINIKNGSCSEDCKFCAQSIHYKTNIIEYPLLTKNELKNRTAEIYEKGFKRISFVASGKQVEEEDFQVLIETIDEIKQEFTDINLCLSLGLLTKEQIKVLENVGIDRLHNNLETSEKYFEHICTTHSYDDKLKTLKYLDNDKINICSGGIFGLGESFEDRIDLAIQLREYDVKSIPINILNPIKGTPLENNTILKNDEVCRIIAIFRFINPESYIRLAGGRLLLEDNGRKAFQSGANAAILGDMLTTKGVQYGQDVDMIKQLEYDTIVSIK